jgi:hypothetical protein
MIAKNKKVCKADALPLRHEPTFGSGRVRTRGLLQFQRRQRHIQAATLRVGSPSKPPVHIHFLISSPVASPRSRWNTIDTNVHNASTDPSAAMSRGSGPSRPVRDRKRLLPPRSVFCLWFSVDLPWRTRTRPHAILASRALSRTRLTRMTLATLTTHRHLSRRVPEGI